MGTWTREVEVEVINMGRGPVGLLALVSREPDRLNGLSWTLERDGQVVGVAVLMGLTLKELKTMPRLARPMWVDVIDKAVADKHLKAGTHLTAAPRFIVDGVVVGEALC